MTVPQLPISGTEVIAVAGSVYGILQAAKKAGLSAFLTGRVGEAFSVAFSFFGVIVVSGNLSPDTIFAAAVAALTAAGIHAHVQVATTGKLGAAPKP